MSISVDDKWRLFNTPSAFYTSLYYSKKFLEQTVEATRVLLIAS
ncbi:d66268f5-a960-430e-8cf7-47d1e23a2b5d [Thermothielavioides terrestris]|uniref:D66268f5-a960-430e-8cf7-47d1e23a2b5d n=1 Tax=Thermothielavioides terrestris TaxID=2587410 RepID=A0A446BPN9_9PEZI|nr:d66268f5-a960-430e-8cf7-47d1e23a2b5d [Thermothielavioides terrestris]